jgi:hypothetical protein
MSLSHRCCDFWRAQNRLLKERRSVLAFELAFGPAFPNSRTGVKLALFGSLALAKNDEVGPRQLSHQWRDNSAISVSLVELPHSK